MKKKWLSLLSLIFAVSSATILPNQNKIQPSVFLFNGTGLCDGIYLDATSFQYNRPDYQLADLAMLDAISKLLLSVKRGHGVELPPIVIDGEEINSQIWCITLEGIPFLQYRNAFYPITHLGRYSSFFKTVKDPTAVVGEHFPDPAAGVMALNAPQSLHPAAFDLFTPTTHFSTQGGIPTTGMRFLVDMETGEISPLNDVAMTHLLDGDPALLNAFTKEEDPDLLSYLIRFNRKYPWLIEKGNCR